MHEAVYGENFQKNKLEQEHRNQKLIAYGQPDFVPVSKKKALRMSELGITNLKPYSGKIN